MLNRLDSGLRERLPVRRPRASRRRRERTRTGTTSAIADELNRAGRHGVRRQVSAQLVPQARARVFAQDERRWRGRSSGRACSRSPRPRYCGPSAQAPRLAWTHAYLTSFINSAWRRRIEPCAVLPLSRTSSTFSTHDTALAQRYLDLDGDRSERSRLSRRERCSLRAASTAVYACHGCARSNSLGAVGYSGHNA